MYLEFPELSNQIYPPLSTSLVVLMGKLNYNRKYAASPKLTLCEVFVYDWKNGYQLILASQTHLKGPPQL